MDPGIRDFVGRRAAYACEYCHIPQQATPLIPFHVEHIVSRQHETRALVALFNPRADIWSEHFALRDGHIVGLTPTGRASVRLLNMNAARRVELRRAWHELREG